MTSVAKLFQNHRLYPEFLQVKQRLKQNQFVCWVAGGAVRDLYLGRDCHDFDLVTDASTENLKALFPEALLVGEKFGVLKIALKNGEFFDLATFRQESDYVDGRRPSHVSASTPVSDAGRRDFTINALFWDDENGKLVDYVGGTTDLEAKKIQAVGDAGVRFSEDHLRILRLVRFAAQLNFEIEAETQKAAMERVSLVDKVSGERIWAELKKLKSSAEWNRVLELQLFRKICQEVFKTSFENTPRLVESRRDQEASAHLFFVLSTLSLDSEEMKKKLTERLHLSREERNRFDLFMMVKTKFSFFSSEKLALELEKKPQLQAVMQYVVYQNAFDAEVFKKAQEILKLYPQPLLSGEDLKSIVDVRQIGLALNELRIRQFEGAVVSREQAFIFVKHQFSRDKK